MQRLMSIPQLLTEILGGVGANRPPPVVGRPKKVGGNRVNGYIAKAFTSPTFGPISNYELIHLKPFVIVPKKQKDNMSDYHLIE